MVALAGKLMKMREYAVMLEWGGSAIKSVHTTLQTCTLLFANLTQPSLSLEPCHLRRKPRMTIGWRPHFIVSGARNPNRIPPATCAG